MPRNVRNFWIEAEIDGRATPLAGGPVRKEGGFHLRVMMRDKGGIITPAFITGTADADGALTLSVNVSGQPATIVYKTTR